jgi:hypothetical protein
MEGQDMSRIATPPLGQSVGSTLTIPREKVAQRAYEKWVKRGRTHGHDLQDWMEAEAELRAELSRQGTGGSSYR